MADQRTCNDCGTTFDASQPGTWLQITGWVVQRTDGGPNAVRLRRETGPALCHDCGKLRDLGVIPGQESLL